MGKTFVIMEVEEWGNDGWIPPKRKRDDETWIDSRHVIDGERLRWGVALKGEMIFEPGSGGTPWMPSPFPMCDRNWILDPPKPETEEEKWRADCPLTEWTPAMRNKLADWIMEAVKKRWDK